MRIFLSHRLIMALVVSAGLTACAGRGTVALPAGASYDALVPVPTAGLQNAWVRPGIDLRSYRRVQLAPVAMQFRPTRPGADSPLRRSREREFPVNSADQQRLADTVTGIFREELGRSRALSLTDDDGSDVLLVQATLLDIVSRVPPEGPGRTDIYVDEVGAATLVVEIRDAATGELLARAVDRREVDPLFGAGGRGDLMRANSVTAWTEVRRVVRRWGNVLTRQLDELHTG